MSVYDDFDNMEDFLVFMKPLFDDLERKGDIDTLNAVMAVCGILPNQALRTIEIPNIGIIDEDLYDIILWMNKHNLETQASCSGTIDDHGQEKEGYISILDSKEAREFADKLNYVIYEDIFVENGKAYFKDSICIRFKNQGLETLRRFINGLADELNKRL